MQAFFITTLLAASEVTPAIKEPNFMTEFVHMLFTLFIVLGLAVATLFFLRRLMRSRAQVLNDASGIKILEKRMLNQKSALYLVDILGKGIVIAESSHGIHPLAEFPSGVNVELLLDELQIEKKPKANFFASFPKKLKEAVKNNPKNST